MSFFKMIKNEFWTKISSVWTKSIWVDPVDGGLRFKAGNFSTKIIGDATASADATLTLPKVTGAFNPISARGDLIIGDVSGSKRLPISTTNYAVLRSNSTEPVWTNFENMPLSQNTGTNGLMSYAQAQKVDAMPSHLNQIGFLRAGEDATNYVPPTLMYPNGNFERPYYPADYYSRSPVSMDFASDISMSGYDVRDVTVTPVGMFSVCTNGYIGFGAANFNFSPTRISTGYNLYTLGVAFWTGHGVDYSKYPRLYLGTSSTSTNVYYYDIRTQSMGTYATGIAQSDWRFVAVGNYPWNNIVSWASAGEYRAFAYVWNGTYEIGLPGFSPSPVRFTNIIFVQSRAVFIGTAIGTAGSGTAAMVQWNYTNQGIIVSNTESSYASGNYGYYSCPCWDPINNMLVVFSIRNDGTHWIMVFSPWSLYTQWQITNPTPTGLPNSTIKYDPANKCFWLLYPYASHRAYAFTYSGEIGFVGAGNVFYPALWWDPTRNTMMAQSQSSNNAQPLTLM